MSVSSAARPPRPSQTQLVSELTSRGSVSSPLKWGYSAWLSPWPGVLGSFSPSRVCSGTQTGRHVGCPLRSGAFGAVRVSPGPAPAAVVPLGLTGHGRAADTEQK